MRTEENIARLGLRLRGHDTHRKKCYPRKSFMEAVNSFVGAHGGWSPYISGFFTFLTAIIAFVSALISAWRNHKASEKLAEQQKEYTSQIETLKNQLAFELARKTKFAEKEFEVLTHLWEELQQTDRIIMQLGKTISLNSINECSLDDIMDIYNSLSVRLEKGKSYFYGNVIFIDAAVGDNVRLLFGIKFPDNDDPSYPGGEIGDNDFIDDLNEFIKSYKKIRNRVFPEIGEGVRIQLTFEEKMANKKEQAVSGGES